MIIELGKTYETRSGRTVRIVCVSVKNASYPVVGLVENDDGSETAHTFGSNGVYWSSRGENPYDLIREHIPVTFKWVNVYKKEGEGITGFVHNTLDEAADCANVGAMAGQVKFAFDPSGNLIVDKCEIISTSKAGV